MGGATGSKALWIVHFCHKDYWAVAPRRAYQIFLYNTLRKVIYWYVKACSPNIYIIH